ncbi:family 43 glycosylhydrolase [Paenibacillus phytohabitans]|uniref:family 43 glycosylhydrolase n=1 Tax=Paenibacillus phytohabitans TaxID=2654978 RepID=UPI0030096A2D
MTYICNPLNIEYKYQFVDTAGTLVAFREAADPTLVIFHGQYYLFSSMTAGFLTSSNLTDWTLHPLKGVPVYDYAPDVRVIGEYLYFSASNKSRSCSFYRTKDPINSSFEEIQGMFPFWDPNLFLDVDGRVYFYWGCSNQTPIYGVELNPETMIPIEQPIALIYGNSDRIGYERKGEDHNLRSPEQIDAIVQKFTSINPGASEEIIKKFKGSVGNDPYIEGAWMERHNGKYYLQYASPGTEHNIYSDGVYISDNPLGPFTLANNNPFSYKPGGFIPGAGHGSTMNDNHGNLWHASSMRISMSHIFERRLGLWPAGFDQDGELFCNQRYGDWPYSIVQSLMNPWSNPQWMLLSYGKPARASSSEKGKEASKATNENVQTWWKAHSNTPGEWLEVDLGYECSVYAVQINFADDQMHADLPSGTLLQGDRLIDERQHVTRWLLEGSVDGCEYFVIKDKTTVNTDLPHDLIVQEEGTTARFIKCTVMELPFNQPACISGLRVFGIGKGVLPKQASGIKTHLLGKLDLSVKWNRDETVGNNVLWGFAPDKLYHSHMLFDCNQVTIKALIEGQPVYVRVDTFNEKGITEGEVYKAV